MTGNFIIRSGIKPDLDLGEEVVSPIIIEGTVIAEFLGIGYVSSIVDSTTWELTITHKFDPTDLPLSNE